MSPGKDVSKIMVHKYFNIYMTVPLHLQLIYFYFSLFSNNEKIINARLILMELSFLHLNLHITELCIQVLGFLLHSICLSTGTTGSLLFG